MCECFSMWSLRSGTNVKEDNGKGEQIRGKRREKIRVARQKRDGG